MAQEPELDPILSSLQSALREHTDRLRKLAAAKLATNLPSHARIVAAPKPQSRVDCDICGALINLEDSKVNEDGLPVHEECYVAKLTLSKPVLQPQAD